MSKSWSSVSSVNPEKDWSSVYTNHGTPSVSDEGTPSSTDDSWMEPAGDDIDNLNENRRRLVDIGFDRGTGAGGGKRKTRGGKRKTRGGKRKTRGKKRKTRKNRSRRRRR
jgi:hypothetical protein